MEVTALLALISALCLSVTPGAGFIFHTSSIQLISQYSVVTPGERVQFRCSGTPCRGYRTVYLYRNVFPIKSQYCQYQSSVIFTLSIADASDAGHYKCVFSRQHSQSISVTVVVLVQPNISVFAPDGGLFWGSQGPEVSRGHSLSLICSTEPQYQGGSFHLIFDGSNRTQIAINHSASFYIPEADYSHQGNYSCVYEVTLSTRTFSSTQTAPLTITVTAALSPIIAIGVMSGLFLFLVVPVILHLVKKKCLTETSRRNSGPLPSSGPSCSVNRYAFSNGPGGSDEDNSIYMNTAVHAERPDCGKDIDGDMEEVYVNAEVYIGNCHKEDEIYENY